jgi:folate-binding protein YgfZ
MKIQVSKTRRQWLKASGEDTVRFLSGMWTADIKRAVEKGVHSTGRSFLLNIKGKAVVESQFWVLNKQEILFSIPEGFWDSTFEALDKLLVADDVRLDRAELSEFVYEIPSLPIEVSQKWGQIEHYSWQIPDAQDKVYRGIETELFYLVPKFRLSDSHFEIWPKARMDSAQLESILGSGVEWLPNLNSQRIDAGVPLWGVDYSPEDLILEFPHKDAISFHKGCYIGQEVVARATYRGKMTKSLVRLEFDRPPESGYFYNESNLDQPIGKITSLAGLRCLGLARTSSLENAVVVQKSGAKAIKIEIIGG